MSRQLQLTQKGGPFKVVDVPKPTPGPDQAVVRQKVIAFNPIDCKQRDLGLFIKEYPHILGIEGAGVVDAVGSDVKDLKPGDEVTGWLLGMTAGQGWGGAFQEYVVAPVAFLAKKPKNISLEESASLLVAWTTAVAAISDLGIALPFLPIKLEKENTLPQSVLILGGSSVVGAATIQLLRLASPSMTIFATSSSKHHQRLSSLGATKAFDYHKSSIVSDIKAAASGDQGVDLIIDCVSAGAAQADICDTLSSTGSRKYALVLTGVDVTVPKDVTKLDINAFSVLGMNGGKETIGAITGLVEDGRFRVPMPVKTVGHGLEQIPDVLDKAMSVSGEKLIVTL